MTPLPVGRLGGTPGYWRRAGNLGARSAPSLVLEELHDHRRPGAAAVGLAAAREDLLDEVPELERDTELSPSSWRSRGP